MSEPPVDPLDVRIATGAPDPLRDFNRAGVLAAADVHVATRLCELAGTSAPEVLLAVALAVRAPRIGHVHVDLTGIAATAAVDAEGAVEVAGLAWPEPAAWVAAVGAAPLVTAASDGDARPLRLDGTWLYLDRLWAAERSLAAGLTALCEPVPGVAAAALEAGLARLFAAEDIDQAEAAATAVTRRLSVIAGGPGTGKTTTVGRIVALLGEQARARGQRPPLIALAAPTGKASARLAQAVHEQARDLVVDPEVRELLGDLRATTLHRLLGLRPGGRPRYDAEQRLPHDVVIVDETSMVSLSLMERLVAAVRPQARLVLVGDPGQLASIEAGAVLGDIVGPAGAGPDAAGAHGARAAPPIAAAIAVLDRVHRFGGAIAPLARAVRAGDGDAVVERLTAGSADLVWLPVPDAGTELQSDSGSAEDAGAALRDRAVRGGASVFAAAAAGDAAAALEALGAFRILCAHRRGPHGVSTATARVLGWLADVVPEFDPNERFFLGRPLLLTENDPELGLFNGDTGVVVRGAGARAVAAFERRGEVAAISPARLAAVDTVYAMTIHKSQGSQFREVAIVLPPPDSRLLTRELLYTAVTRATESLLVIGSEASVRVAVGRPIARASGLRRRLWGDEGVAMPRRG